MNVKILSKLRAMNIFKQFYPKIILNNWPETKGGKGFGITLFRTVKKTAPDKFPEQF